jgi:hypothetical protein
MAIRFNETVQEWKSLPLTAGDVGDLARLCSPGPERMALAELSGFPPEGEVSEPELLHAVFAAGLRLVHDTAEARTYAEAALARRAAEQRDRKTGLDERDGPGAVSAGPGRIDHPEAS